MPLSRLLILLLLCAVTALHAAEADQRPYPKVDLLSFLEKWQATPATSRIIYELNPHWVGTIKGTQLRGKAIGSRDDAPQNLRLSHLIIQEGDTNLTLFRGNPPSIPSIYSSAHEPVFMRQLPAVQSISEVKALSDLRNMFGPYRGVHSGWQFNDRKNWMEFWACFTAEPGGKLRFLHVTAHVHSSEWRDAAATIHDLHITEGFFRPSDPNSAAELSQFKTGAEVEAEYQADLAKARLKYPQPLRSLVEARQTPGDSDLVAYKRALNDVRRNPSPELLGQLVEWLSDGVEVRLMLDYILFDGFLELDKWKIAPRAIALRALTDSLPRVKTNLDLEHLIAVLLRSQGGGELKLTHLNAPSQTVDVSVKVELKENGHSTTFDSHVPEEFLPVVTKLCRDALKEKYPELRSQP